MKYSPTPNHHFENFTLKRDKGSFRMSTAAFSTTRTPAHNQNNNEHQYPQDNQQTQKPSNPFQIPHPTLTPSTTHNPHPTNQLQNSSSLKTLSKIIHNKKTPPQTSTSHTHSYYHHHPPQPQHELFQSSPCTQIISKQNFPPKIIKQLCNREQQKQTDGNIEYHYGMLSKSGYLYFCIQKLLVFVRCFNYLVGDQSQNQQPIILQMDQHVLAIKEIVVADLDIEDIQRHPFGSKSIIFMIWFQWRVQLFSYQQYQLIKIKDLNLKFNTSNQSSFQFDYTKSGDIFYLTQQGQLSKLQFMQPSTFFFIKNNKKYSIKQYFYKFKHNTKRKHQTYTKNGLIYGIKQFWKDIRYFWKDKIRKGIKIVCDRDNDRVLTLVETRVRRDGKWDCGQDDVHKEIRVYDVAKDRNKGVIAKLQSSLYHDPPHLLLQITQQKLYSQIGIHLFNNLSLSKFQFSNIHIPPHNPKSRHPTNLLITLQTGNRLYLHISSQRMILNQMINLPNLDEILMQSSTTSTKVLAYRDGYVGGNKIISQKENIGFRVIRDQFVGDQDVIVVGALRKAVVGVGFGSWGVSGETVVVVHDVPIQSDQKTSNSIFINHSDYNIFKCPQLYETRPKKHLQHLLHKSTLRLPHLPHLLTHQCLHYPCPTLLQTSASQIKVLLKQRPIDKILSIINNELNKIQKNINITNIVYNDAEICNVIQKLCQCMQAYQIQRGQGIQLREAVVEMLVQVYCDVDGVYYFQMLRMRAGANRQRKNVSMQNHRNSFNFNNPNIFQNSNSTPTQNRPTEPIPSPNTHSHKPPTYKKYRHSDLCTSQQTNSEHEHEQTTIPRNRSPLKIRSDNSIIKFIERLIIYVVKMQANKMQYTNKIKQGQWVYGCQGGREANWEGVERILLGYIGRILGCVWEWKIQDVDRSVFNYIAELCQKYLQLLTKISDSQPSINLSPVSNMLTILHQYNKLLHQLLIPIPISYSQALLQPITIFSEPIFLTLQKLQNNYKQTIISSTITKYRQQFPYYFSLDLFKTIKLQAQINNVSNLQDRKMLVLREAYRMPKYLLKYYVGVGVVGWGELEGLMKRDMKEGQIQIKGNYRINELLESVKSMDPYQKYEYLMTQLQKDSYNLSQKQILLTYQTKFLQQIKTLSPTCLKSHKTHITHLTTILKLQQQIIKYLQQQSQHQSTSSRVFNININIGIGIGSNGHKSNPNKIEISDKTKYLLNHILMTTTQLKKLVISLGSNTVLFIFYACFCEGSQDVQIGLRDMVWEQGGKEDNVRGVLIKVFDMGGKVRLSSLAPVLDQICYNNIQTQNLKPLLQSPLQTICKTLWIPNFLVDHKYNKNELYNHYTAETKKHHIRISLKKNKQFMYNWLNAYIIVKMYYTEARRMFQVFTQALGDVGDVGDVGDGEGEIRELVAVLEQSFK